MTNQRRYVRALTLAWILLPMMMEGVAFAKSFDKNQELSRLVSKDSNEQREAMRRLEKEGDDALPDILDIVIKNGDRDAKVRAAWTARKILKRTKKPSEQVLAALERMGADPDYIVADSALAISADLKSERTRKLLRNAVKSHPNEGIRGKAITALQMASGANVSELDSFQKALLDPSDTVKMRAAAALGRIGRNDGLDAVINILSQAPDGKQAGIIVEAAHAAAMIGDRKAIPSLEKVTTIKVYGPARVHAAVAIQEIEFKRLPAEQRLDLLKKDLRDAKVASWAAAKLKELGTRQAISILKETAADSKHPAQEEAARVLKQPNIDE